MLSLPIPVVNAIFGVLFLSISVVKTELDILYNWETVHTNYKLQEMKMPKTNKTKQDTKLTESHVLLKVSSVYIPKLKKN